MKKVSFLNKRKPINDKEQKLKKSLRELMHAKKDKYNILKAKSIKLEIQ